ncbi:hypothetical protein C8J56DRAFT_885676 [Mycena floridula]|nr:hypothetical protein C8J56DRAFT_885676 [Mycena floridula]
MVDAPQVQVSIEYFNSKFLLSGRALKYRDAIFRYVAVTEDSQLRKFALSDDDWAISSSSVMSSTKKPMLPTVHAIFYGLQKTIREELAKLPSSVNPGIKQGLLDAQRKLSNYYFKFDQSVHYTWAASYETLCREYKNDLDLIAHLESSKASLQERFDNEYAHRAGKKPVLTIQLRDARHSSMGPAVTLTGKNRAGSWRDTQDYPTPDQIGKRIFFLALQGDINGLERNGYGTFTAFLLWVETNLGPTVELPTERPWLRLTLKVETNCEKLGSALGRSHEVDRLMTSILDLGGQVLINIRLSILRTGLDLYMPEGGFTL